MSNKGNFKGTYSQEWKAIATRVKDKAGNCCERCRWPDDKASGHVLTVHHLDGDKSNNAEYNLAALCQRCHLHIQGKVNMFQCYMFTHSLWFIPHVEGFNQAMKKTTAADPRPRSRVATPKKGKSIVKKVFQDPNKNILKLSKEKKPSLTDKLSQALKKVSGGKKK